jgi:glycerol uptake facilitator protein
MSYYDIYQRRPPRHPRRDARSEEDTKAKVTTMARTRGGSWRRSVWGEALSESLGTFVLVVFGNGVVAMAVAALNQSGRGSQGFVSGGDWLLITWGWALAVTFGVYVAGGVSGAHINPAVTLGLAVRRGFPWRKVPVYIAAQTVGAFLGAALVYLLYHDAISSFEAAGHISRGALGGPADSTPTYSIFATFPAPYFGTSLVGPLVDQIVGTAMLLLLVMALTDERNQPPKANLAPLLIGLVVAAIGMSLGANAGYAINPARDFGPRVFAWLAGWGQVALPGANGYFWVPIVGPLIGGVLGAAGYDWSIGPILRARGIQPAEVESAGRTVEDQDGDRTSTQDRTGRER